MYESPIELIVSQMHTSITHQQEDMVMEAVQQCGVNVNKDELVEALNFDRQQYSKGYSDGMKDFAAKLLDRGIATRNYFEIKSLVATTLHEMGLLKE